MDYSWNNSSFGNRSPKIGDYGEATMSRLLKIVGLFCKRALQKRPIFSKETCNFKEPTNLQSRVTTKIIISKCYTMLLEDFSDIFFELKWKNFSCGIAGSQLAQIFCA